MNPPLLVVIALVVAALAGLWHARGHGGLRRLLSPAAAVALYLCLFPPAARVPLADDALVVLTPGATADQLAALPRAAERVALPGAPADATVERVPDLGTALRRHAQARRLHVVGGGLPARDRDAARQLVATFDAAPLPRGLVELDAPSSVLAGHAWLAEGRVEGVAGGRVELRDPSGVVAASSALVAAGRFSLAAHAKGEGRALFALHVFDRDGAQVERVPLPIAARAGVPLRVLLMAGAPDPELKYLRRWATDAGLALDGRIALSDGIALTDGSALIGDSRLDAAALHATDVAIIDERAWASLDATARRTLIEAVRGGLGLLLRPTGDVPEAVAADWASLGYALKSDEPRAPVALDRRLGLGDSGLLFTPRPLAVETADAAALLRADDGSALGWMRDVGEGRVGLWLLPDSYRLALGGAAPAFASLWSDLLGTLARARGAPPPRLPVSTRIDERAVLCGLGRDAAIEGDAGERTPLAIGSDGCAAFWPDAAGWVEIVDDASHWPLYVRGADEAPALAAGERARATRALLGATHIAAASAERDVPLPRWPFFLAFVALAAWTWWLERTAPKRAAD